MLVAESLHPLEVVQTDLRRLNQMPIFPCIPNTDVSTEQMQRPTHLGIATPIRRLSPIPVYLKSHPLVKPHQAQPQSSWCRILR